MVKHIWIVEVGYCAATRYHNKMTEKQQQHAQLVSLLESLDHRVMLPVLLGTTQVHIFTPANCNCCSL